MRICIPISFFGLSDKNKSENAGLKFSTCTSGNENYLVPNLAPFVFGNEAIGIDADVATDYGYP
jgi:hypothetical protein